MDEPRKKTPYPRFGGVERPVMGSAVEIVGNTGALLQLRAQIDRAQIDWGTSSRLLSLPRLPLSPPQFEE
jgi:hypothetical protein